MKTLPLMALATALALIGAATLTGCTENTKAKAYGGTMNVDLPPGQKLLTVTWKTSNSSADLWYLTRPMREGEVAETSTLQEKSNFGIMEGKVVFKESLAK